MEGGQTSFFFHILLTDLGKSSLLQDYLLQKTEFQVNFTAKVRIRVHLYRVKIL